MGMPLYALKDYKEEKVEDALFLLLPPDPQGIEDLTEEEVFRANSLASGRGSMSASLDRMPQGRRTSISDLSGVPGRSRAR